MIGNLYFVIKSSVVTFAIVCLLQIQFKNRTLEDRLMNFVRSTLAPQVLGLDKTQINHSDYKMSPEEMAELKKRIFNSKALQGVRDSAKAVFVREMENVMNNKDSDNDNADKEQ